MCGTATLLQCMDCSSCMRSGANARQSWGRTWQGGDRFLIFRNLDQRIYLVHATLSRGKACSAFVSCCPLPRGFCTNSTTSGSSACKTRFSFRSWCTSFPLLQFRLFDTLEIYFKALKWVNDMTYVSQARLLYIM